MKALFTPRVVSEVLVQVRTILAERSRTAPAKAEGLEAEAARLKREIERLTLAIATTDDAPGALIRRWPSATSACAMSSTSYPPYRPQTFAIELDHLERDVMSRLDNLVAKLDASPDRPREMLSALTAGERLRFEPCNGTSRVVGSAAVPGLLMAGTAPDRFASPAGFDTFRSAVARMPRMPIAV